MKVAFYIADNIEQIVLTPETEHEKRMMDMLHNGQREFSIKRGSFYECQGGWLRQGSSFGLHDADRSDDSTIIVLRQKQVQAGYES